MTNDEIQKIRRTAETILASRKKTGRRYDLPAFNECMLRVIGHVVRAAEAYNNNSRADMLMFTAETAFAGSVTPERYCGAYSHYVLWSVEDRLACAAIETLYAVALYRPMAFYRTPSDGIPLKDANRYCPWFLDGPIVRQRSFIEWCYALVSWAGFIDSNSYLPEGDYDLRTLALYKGLETVGGNFGIDLEKFMALRLTLEEKDGGRTP